MGQRHANEQKTTCALPFPATLLRKVLFDSVGITLPDEHAPVLKKTAPPSKSARLPSNWVSLIVTCVVQSIKKRSPKNSSTGQFFFYAANAKSIGGTGPSFCAFHNCGGKNEVMDQRRKLAPTRPVWLQSAPPTEPGPAAWLAKKLQESSTKADTGSRNTAPPELLSALLLSKRAAEMVAVLCNKKSAPPACSAEFSLKVVPPRMAS